MQIIQFHKYGAPQVLEIAEADMPEPGSNEVCVRVNAAAINPKDCLIRKGKFSLMTGKKFPQTLGQDFAGQIESLGPGVTGFQRSARVFGMVNRWSGGAYAEYIVAPVSELAHMPETVSYEQAAAVPLAAQTALQALRDLANLQPGQRVLINGASGGVGSFALQIAKVLGAHVTAVCSDANLNLARELGADAAVDYRKSDPLTLESRFDVVFDVFGNKDFPRSKHLLTPQGVYINTIPNLKTVAWHLLTRWTPGKSGLLVAVRSRSRDLETLAGWITAGKIDPLIDCSLPLAEAQAAHSYIETKRARGKVILVV